MNPPAAAAGPGGRKPEYLVGFDAEWTQAGEGRRVLSYQFAVRCPSEGLWFVAVYQVTGSGTGMALRYSLGRLLGHFLRLADSAAALSAPLPSFQAAAIARKSGKGGQGGKGGSGGEKDRPALGITLAGHYSLVDITTLHGGSKLLRKMDSIRRTEVSVEAPAPIRLRDHHGHSLRATLVMRDSLLIAAGGAALSDLGAVLGLPKVDLPPGHDKSEMDRFRVEHPDAYIVYAGIDAVITAEWTAKIGGFAKRFGVADVPPTIGSLSTAMTRSMIMRRRKFETVEDFDLYWRGLDTFYERVDDGCGGLREVKRTAPCENLAVTESAWRASFLGGRNECMAHGPHLPGMPGCWWDWDLKGAYAAAMVLLRDIDWTRPPEPVKAGRLIVDDLGPLDYFVGLIEFRFPPNTPYPCIPIRDDHGRGLVFPLRGRCFATAPEICLALLLDAEVRVISGHIHPVIEGPGSLAPAMEAYVAERTKAKRVHGRGSLMELLWKVVSNATYGTLGQGLRGKTSYSTRHDASRSIPPSRITCAPYAAVTTGIVRAVVSATMAELAGQGHTILSVTTDGFLCDADAAVLRRIESFGFVKLLSDARLTVTGDGEIWEAKHAASMMVMSRTRAGFGVGPVEGYDLPCAAAGYVQQPEDDARIESGALLPELLAAKFANRDANFQVTFRQMPSPQDYVRRKADGVPKKITRKVRWDYDFKRRPDPATITTGDVLGRAHVSFHTRPFETIEDFAAMRGDYDEIRPILRTETDMRDFLARCEARLATGRAGIRRAGIADGGMRRTAAMAILRGIRQDVIRLGVPVNGPTVRRVLSEAFEIPINSNDWKNAARPGRRPEHVLTEAMIPHLRAAAAELLVDDWVLWASSDAHQAYHPPSHRMPRAAA